MAKQRLPGQLVSYRYEWSSKLHSGMNYVPLIVHSRFLFNPEVHFPDSSVKSIGYIWLYPEEINKHYAMKKYNGYGDEIPVFYILPLGGGLHLHLN
jgi:hypothetical protein